jgi:hypothetical protein
MTIVAVESCLIMFCDRVWDTSSDVQSIPNAVVILATHSEDVIARRSSDTDAKFIGGWHEEQKSQIEKIKLKCEAVRSSKVRKVIRIIRSENYSHLTENSRDRARHFPIGFENHDVTRNDLISFAKMSLDLIDKIEIVRTGTNRDYDGASQVFQRYCDEFWDAMPILAEAERNSDG